MASSNVRTRRIIQNFHLIWLHEDITEVNKDNFDHSITKLQEIVTTINTFTDTDKCIAFIVDMKQEQTLLILSEELVPTALPIAHELSQVNSIYILDSNHTLRETLTKSWSKVKGIFTDITTLYEKLKHGAKECDQNLLSISFVKKIGENYKVNLDELDCTFMYTQLLKEILLTIDFEQTHMHEFLTYCREQVVENGIQLRKIDKIEKEYRNYHPIWWYSYESILYSMLNRALRLMELDIIIKMGFFLKDLHNHIVDLHSEQISQQHNPQILIVYRGQGLFETDFHKLQQTQGGLISFNNFLSTSLDRAVSLAFAESVQCNSNMIGILFEITIDSSIPSSPFANIKHISNYEEEEEVLFSMHSIFRIGQTKQMDEYNRLWQVDLTLTSDNDPELHTLTEHIRKETSTDKKGWHRLGELLVNLGQYDKAQQLYDILHEQTNDEEEQAWIYHMLGRVRNGQGKYEDALEYHKKASEIVQKIFSPTHSALSMIYSSFGRVYKNMGEYSTALSYFEKELEINEKTLPPNHSDLANSYNSISGVYKTMGEYSKALSYYTKALEIKQKIFPPNHPRLATLYDNIGFIYKEMGEYSKALSSCEEALKIYQKVLPENHPDVAISYNNTGMIFYAMREYSKALSYYNKGIDIYQKTLSSNHPQLATVYDQIAAVYKRMKEYSKALSYSEKALDIYHKTLPANHLDLAITYNNTGSIYDKMGEYSKALSYYERALDISQRSLPPDHPDIKRVKGNIELVKKQF